MIELSHDSSHPIGSSSSSMQIPACRAHENCAAEIGGSGRRRETNIKLSVHHFFCVLVLTLTCSHDHGVTLRTTDICCVRRSFALRAAAMNVVEDCDSYDSDGSDDSFLELMEPVEVSKSR